MKKKESGKNSVLAVNKRKPQPHKIIINKKSRTPGNDEMTALLLKNTGQLFYICDVKTGAFTWHGDASAFFGGKKKKMPADFYAMQKIIHPDDLKNYLKGRRKAVKDRTPLNLKYRLLTGKKGPVAVIETASPFFNEKNNLFCLTGSIAPLAQSDKNESKAEDEFLSILNEMPHFIYRINRKGEIVYANKAYAASFNLSTESILGKSAYDLHPKKLADKYTDDNNRVFRSKKTFYAVEDHILKSGHREIVEVIKIPLFDDKKRVTGLQGVFWYITDLLAAQEGLKVAANDYKEIFNATSDAIFVHNSDTGAILDVNETALKMYGYTRKEMLNATVEDISSGEGKYNLKSAIRHIRYPDSKQVYTFEWKARHKSGKTFWVEVSLRKSVIGGRKRVLAVVRDISKRREDEKALFLSQVSINTSRDGVIWFSREGKILFLNDAAFDMLKYAKRDIYNQTIFDIDRGADIHSWNNMLKEMNRSGSILIETEFSDKKNNVIPVEIALSYYRYLTEDIIFSVIRDITYRKVGDDRLKESEKRYRDITELLPQGIYECDLNGTVTYSNKRLFEMLQRTPEELKKGFSVLQALIPENRDSAAENMRGLLLGKEVRPQEYSMVRKDGSVFPGTIYSAVVYNNQNPIGFRGIIIDLTDKIAFETEKREHDSLFSLLFEKAGDANLLIEEDHFIDCNETTVKVLGAKSKEEVISRHPSELSPEYQPDGELSSDKADRLLKKAFAEGSARFEWVHRKFDGAEFFVEVVLTAIPIKGKWYLHTSWRDITDKKLAEAKEKLYLQRLERLLEIERSILSTHSTEKIAQSALNHLRLFLNCRRASVVLFDKEKDLFTITALDVSGKTNADVGTSFPLNSSPWQNLSSGEINTINDFAKLENITPVDKILLGEGIRSRISVPLIIDNSVRGTLNLSSGNPSNFTEESIKIVQDVSVSIALAIQHSEFVDKINRQNSELEKMVDERTARLKQTISELESFSYSVSHDLRAPLRSIGGYSQALIDDYSATLGDEGKSHLNRIVAASHKMSDLIDALLLLARIIRSELTIEPVHLSDMVLSALSELQKSDEERNKVILNIQPGIKVKGDPKLLRIAIENLVSNAWKFTKKNGKTIIEFGMARLGGEEVLYIKDNGVGFDMTYINKLFGAFQRLHSPDEFEGTGIGLATTKRIIQRHGGKIWAESKLDQGAVFYFTLNV